MVAACSFAGMIWSRRRIHKHGVAALVGQGWLLLMVMVGLPYPVWAQNISFGSGIVISDEGHILTARHVVKDHAEVLVGPVANNRWLRAKVLKTDAENDLALLKSAKIGEPLSIADWQTVPIGLEVYAIGFPHPRQMGFTKKITQGIINSDHAGNRNPKNFQFSAEIQQGNSGGPLIAPDGLVVGMVQRKLNALKVAEKSEDLPQNVNYGLKSDLLIDFVRSAGLDVTVKPVNIEANARPYEIFRFGSKGVVSILVGVRQRPQTKDSELLQQPHEILR